MYKYLLAMFLLILLPVIAFAEEVAESTGAAPEEGLQLTPLQQGIVAVVTMVLMWGFKLLRSKLKVGEEQNKLDANKSLLEQKEILLRRIGATATRVAETWVEDHIPALVKDATDGNGFDWKAHFRQGFNHVKQEVRQVFADEGIDILKVIGERRLAGMIKAALSKSITWLPEKVKGFIPKDLLGPLSEKISSFVTARTSDWVEDLVKSDRG